LEAQAKADDILARAERDRLSARARAGSIATTTERRRGRTRLLRTEAAAAVVLLLVAFVLVALA
jgi:hypothetical protein